MIQKLNIRLPALSGKKIGILSEWIVDISPALSDQWANKGYKIPKEEVTNAIKSACVK